MTIRNFLAFSVIYAAFAVVVVLLFHPGGLIYATDAIGLARALADSLVRKVPWIGAAILVLVAINRAAWDRTRGLDLLAAMAACVFFQVAFSLTKSTLPELVPFFADPALAALDRALHAGIDPYVLTHAVHIPPDWVFTAYFAVWGPIAAFFPVWLVLFDADRARVGRYLTLMLCVWIGLGHVLALSLMSVGPVYYDLLMGGDRFADLTATLGASGLAEGRVGQFQTALWQIYAGARVGVGSGISAFPSVHVGIAMMVLLYLAERWRPLVLPGAAFLLVTLFLSVYIGFHYAIDGYASILLVLAAHAMIARRFKPGTAPTPVPAE